MKYIILILSGLFDRPLNGQKTSTPLSDADTPNLDLIAQSSLKGLVQTVPVRFPSVESAGTLSLFGIKPTKHPYLRTGFEIYGSGLTMKKDDAAFCCSFVSLSENEEYEQKTMLSSSPGISADQIRELSGFLAEKLNSSIFEFRTSKSGNCFLIWHKGESENGTYYPPEESDGSVIEQFLPNGDFTPPITSLMKKSTELLASHPIILRRRVEGKLPVNSIWLWGASGKPKPKSFAEKYSLKAAAFSSSDYFCGIAKLIGIKVTKTDKYLDEKAMTVRAKKAVGMLQNGYDLVYIHNSMLADCLTFESKKIAIENLDRHFIAVLKECADSSGEPYRFLITADNAVPVKLNKPTFEAVPFIIYDSEKTENDSQPFNEFTKTVNYISEGHRIIEKLIE